MKKWLAVVSIICLAGCEKPLPEAPFGLNWSMTKEEAVKLAPEKPRVKKYLMENMKLKCLSQILTMAYIWLCSIKINFRA